MYEMGSTFFDHEEWFEYMEKYGFGFGRVYAAHTWHEDQRHKNYKPLHPFEVRRYTEEGDPVVDLLKADKDYWSNFSRVLDEAEKRLAGGHMAEASLLDVDSAEEGDRVAQAVAERFGIQPIRTSVSPVVGTHAGIGTIGLCFYSND